MTVIVKGVLTPLETLPLVYWKDEAPSPSVVQSRLSAQLREAVAAAPAIPLSIVYEVKKNQSGAHVYAVQRALNTIQFPQWQALLEDGEFGDKTYRAVSDYQWDRFGPGGIDGVVGRNTSGRLIDDLDDQNPADVPKRLREGLCLGESGKLVGAVNWSVAGGVDCCWLQRRIYEQDYHDVDVVHRAWDGRYQLGILADSLIFWYNAFFSGHGGAYPGTEGKNQLSWRAATLYHNYQTLAVRVGQFGIDGLSSYYTSPQVWVKAIDAKFPDGVMIDTPLEWGQHYSLGNHDHDEPGMMTKLVTDWTP